MNAPKIDGLIAEYRDYITAQNLPDDGDAMELLMTDIPTPAQRLWISDFVNRWDAAAEEDPDFYDKQSPAS